MELPINEIPENFKIIDVCASVKAMDEEGTIAVFHRFTEGLNDHEALGRCMSMVDILRMMLQSNFLESGMEEDDDEED